MAAHDHNSDIAELELPSVFNYQKAAIFTEARYAVIEGSTKAGKTWPCIIWLTEMTGRLAGDDHNFWWVAPTLGQADIAYSRTKRMLLHADPTKYWWDSTDQKRRITLHGCGHLWFKTGEEPDNLYGEDVYAAVMDEFTRQREEAWFALRSTLTATEGRCRFIGNVKGRRNWGWRWARKAESGEPNMSYAKFTCWDAVEAGIMSREEVEQAQRDLPEDVFKELYLAEAADDANNPFGYKHIAACLGSGTGQVVAWGVDLAKSRDWTVAMGLNDAGEVVKFERWQAPWRVTIPRLVELIGNAPALVDSTGVGDAIVEELQEHSPVIEGLKFTPASKQQLMQGLAVAIQKREIRFPDGVTRAELESFEYEYTAHGVRYSAPEGSFDDCVCGLALGVRCWRDVQAGTGRVPVFDLSVMQQQRQLLEKRSHPLATGVLTHDLPQGHEQDIAIAERLIDKIAFERDPSGPLKLWCTIQRGRPPIEDPYMLFAAVGDSGTSSCIVIADAIRKTVVGQWTKAVAPERLARVAAMLSTWFGGEEYPAPVGFLANTPGRVFGEHLARLNGMPLEWDANPQEFAEWIGLLRAAWEASLFIERDPAVFAAARQYVYAHQTMMHTSVVGDPQRRGSHADPLIARAGLWRMLSGQGVADLPEREAPVGSPEYRKRERLAKEKRSQKIHFR